MNRTVISALSGFAVVGGLLATAPAWADPPANDSRANAVRLSPPQSVNGTLVGATLDSTMDISECASSDASVWYRFTAPKDGAIIIEVDAGGEMDATVDLFEQVRSKLQFADCAATDRSGLATIDNADLEPGTDYAIRVGKHVGSVAEAFTMRVLVPSPPPQPPGEPLPARGVRGTVDKLLNTGDAYWTRMREGVTMLLSSRVPQCTALAVYAPGTRDFGEDAVKRMRCGGYSLFTPSESGRYVLVVWAGKMRGPQKYRLRVAPARRDDTSPGVFIGNHARVRGSLNGGIDSRDLYRFDVTRRSKLRLWVTGAPDLRLVRDDGRRYGRDSSFDMTVPAGRYYVAVEGAGTYVLHRVSQTITRSVVRFNGRRATTVAPGTSVRMALRVSPVVTGPGVLVLERRDPIDGWQFVRRYRVTVTNGVAQVAFSGEVGHYRLSGEFSGTRDAASSEAPYARLRVQGPLVG